MWAPSCKSPPAWRTRTRMSFRSLMHMIHLVIFQWAIDTGSKGLLKKKIIIQTSRLYSCMVSQIPRREERGCRGRVLRVWETLEKRCRLRERQTEDLFLTMPGRPDTLPLGWELAGVRRGNHDSHSALQGALGVWAKVSSAIECIAYCVPSTVMLSICLQKKYMMF